jgi:hypothetical protein
MDSVNLNIIVNIKTFRTFVNLLFFIILPKVLDLYIAVYFFIKIIILPTEVTYIGLFRYLLLKITLTYNNSRTLTVYRLPEGNYK